MFVGLLLPTCIFGQTVETPQQPILPKHDVGVSVGPMSFTNLFIFGISEALIGGLATLITDEPHNTEWIAVFGAHYYYQANPWIRVGIKGVYEGMEHKVYTNSKKTTIKEEYTTSCLSFMPSCQLTYVHTEWVRVYLGLDLGWTHLWDNKNKNGKHFSEDIMAFNFTPLGLAVGKTFYGMAELNAGSDAFVKVGVGYRF